MKLSILSIVFVMSSVALADASGAGEVKACKKALYKAGCSLNWEESRSITENAKQCKTIESGSGKTQIQAYRLVSGSVVAVVTRAPDNAPEYSNKCDRTWYQIDGNRGVAEMKEFTKNKIVMRSNDNSIFVMYPSQQIRELLSSSGKSYDSRSVKDLKGSSDNKTFTLVMTNKSEEVYDEARLNKKDRDGELSKPFARRLIPVNANLFSY